MKVYLATRSFNRMAKYVGAAVLLCGVAAAPQAHAGSSSLAKTTPGTTDAAEQSSPGSDKSGSAGSVSGDKQDKAARSDAKRPTSEEKTAKAETSPEDAAGDRPDKIGDSVSEPIGTGWETDTQVRPDAADTEITDEEALAIIDKVDAYFNNLDKFKAQFVQTDANNKQKDGVFYFKRPGKVRFDYDRPSMLKIISNGEYLAVENHDLGTSDRYSLDATPFKLLLSEDVNLLRDARILAIDKGENVLILTLEDKTGESAGKIRLFFRTDPELQLASWIITDARGVDTRIDLQSIQRDVELSARLFEFSDIGLPTFNR